MVDDFYEDRILLVSAKFSNPYEIIPFAYAFKS